jgi:PmbA protein
VLEPQVAARVLEFLAPSLLADSYQRGRSLFEGKLGEEVAPACVTLVDDGRLAGGVSTSPFDGEGSPTGRTVVVEKGVLRRLLHDRSSAAREEGAATTGNSMRASFTEPPSLGVTNLMLQPGDEPLASVLSGLGGAFRVVNVVNVGGVNPVTGTFSVAASGVWMEKGRDAHPVAGATLSGNLRDILRQVVAVGDDLGWEHGRGSFASPTLVVEGMTLAG